MANKETNGSVGDSKTVRKDESGHPLKAQAENQKPKTLESATEKFVQKSPIFSSTPAEQQNLKSLITSSPDVFEIEKPQIQKPQLTSKEEKKPESNISLSQGKQFTPN